MAAFDRDGKGCQGVGLDMHRSPPAVTVSATAGQASWRLKIYPGKNKPVDAGLAVFLDKILGFLHTALHTGFHRIDHLLALFAQHDIDVVDQ